VGLSLIVMSTPLRIFSNVQGQGMAFRSQRTPLGAAFPEKPRRLRLGSCHVNGHYLASAQDSTYKNGAIGVIAEDDGHPTEALFSDAKVWKL
jgi:hypothetical protein